MSASPTIEPPSWPPASDDEVRALEDALDVELPDAYRDFLGVFNGGQPKPDVIDIEGLPGSPTHVHEFLGIGALPGDSWP